MPRLVGMAALVYVLFVGAAWGQQGPCGPRDDMLGALSKEFREVPVWRGLSSQGVMIEITAASGGTWTIIITKPGGPACLAIHGEGSEFTPRPMPGRPS